MSEFVADDYLSHPPGDDAIAARIDGLADAARAASGHLDRGAVEAAEAIVEQARVRVRLSSRYTVVALAGATGSGKSSLFNQLCGLDLAAVGVKRPTTSWALSCSWSKGAEALLEWLGVPPRHQVTRSSTLDLSKPTDDLGGLVLLDLPDHDSTEVSHHLEVQRLVGLADLLVWVLDPQKYADAAIHDTFLRPLSTHSDVMLVVFNHADELADADHERTLADVRRLLVADGLGRVPLLVTSAIEGDGVDALRHEVATRVRAKTAAVERLSADIERAAVRLDALAGQGGEVGLEDSDRQRLVDGAAVASGGATLLAEHETLLRERAHRATRWLSTSRLGALRAPDQLQAAVDDSALAGSVRMAADAATMAMPRSWRDSVRGSATARVPGLSGELRAGIEHAGTSFGTPPRWWSAQRLLQWLLVLVAVAGLALLAIDAVRGDLGSRHRLGSVPVGSLLLAGGVLLSVLVALVSRLSATRSVHRLRVDAERTIGQVVSSAVDASVVRPLDEDLEAFRRFRRGVAAAVAR